jgi:hypothetical protein
MNKMLSLALAVFAAATLTACGGGGGEPAPVAVAATDLTVPANGTTTAVATNLPFSFPAGVPSLGTTSTTTVTFTSASATPTFTITAGGHTATGYTTFGSCDFHVVSSDFGSGSIIDQAFVGGNPVIVNPCALKVSTAGQLANALPKDSLVSLLLGDALSFGDPIQVVVNPDGSVTVKGLIIGDITVKLVTG